MSDAILKNAPISEPEWISPLDAIPASGDMALLYSGMQNQGSGNHSWLAHSPAQNIAGDDFDELKTKLSEASTHPWFGYLGYELAHQFETFGGTNTGELNLPAQQWFTPKQLVTWDHQDQSYRGTLPDGLSQVERDIPAITSLHSNMSKQDYLDIVSETKEQIRAGQFYQANITRKFYGTFESAPDAPTIFKKLCEVSPAPFSAYLRFGDTHILSSSPEGFLQIDDKGHITTRPIKGSAKRGQTPQEDADIKAALANSAKDKSENLMIVDLMRNDLSRSCESGSVKVSALYDIHSYATIHQMISTITSKRASNKSSLDVIRDCFPPGSMTGAPKISAMQWIAAKEKLNRGVYSGAIGWIAPNGACDLSVVIRTLIIQGNHFEFQVGGGIVADSAPEAEWDETMIKARGIAKAINLEESRLKAL
ncbi:MAG: aminodeoxychorismate synthase component I [Rickettsiales bacterium]|nr:aminodeoxychorismate synthase component I [Rickettsiales bacterium]